MNRINSIRENMNPTRRSLSLFRILEFIPRRLVVPLGLALQVLVGLLDCRVGYYMSLSLFYLIPICLVTARTGRRNGMLMCVLGAVVLFGVEFSLRPIELNVQVLVLNVALRWGFFVLVTLALTELQYSLHQETMLSRSDPITGLANSRSFTEQLEAEIVRLQRYRRPCSLAYLDLDNFKEVNDKFGHTTGDRLLSHVAKVLKENLRATDNVARLGGDEFAILFPETVLAEARYVLERFRENIEGSAEGQFGRITMSIGLITFHEAPKSAEEAIKIADNLMYAVKHEGRNGIRGLDQL
jgi:diguanylate cyclase (GGDEF)-like protein